MNNDWLVLFMPLLGKLFLYKDILGIAVLILGVCTLLYPILPYILEYGKIVRMLIVEIIKRFYLQ